MPTSQQIQEFINANIGNPAAIAQAMQQYGVTTNDIAGAGFSPASINDYMTQNASAFAPAPASNSIAAFINGNMGDPAAIIRAANANGVSLQDIAGAGFSPASISSYMEQNHLNPNAIATTPQMVQDRNWLTGTGFGNFNDQGRFQLNGPAHDTGSDYILGAAQNRGYTPDYISQTLGGAYSPADIAAYQQQRAPQINMMGQVAQTDARNGYVTGGAPPSGLTPDVLKSLLPQRYSLQDLSGVLPKDWQTGQHPPPTFTDNRAPPPMQGGLNLGPVQAPGQVQQPQGPQPLPQVNGQPLNIQSPLPPQQMQQPYAPPLNIQSPQRAPLPQSVNAPQQQFGMQRPQAPGLPSGPTAPLNLQAPQAAQNRGAVASPDLNIQAPQAPGLPNAQGTPLDVSMPGAPGQVGYNAPAFSFNRPQAPGQVSGVNAPGLNLSMPSAPGLPGAVGAPGGVGDVSLDTLGENPYMGSLLDSLRNQSSRNFAEQAQGIRSNAAAVGGLGGSRQGVAEGIAARGAGDALTNAQANLLYGDYNDRRAQALQKYGQDQGFAVNKGQLANQQFGTNVQQNLGLGTLANERLGTESNFALGAANAQNARYGTDVQQNLGLGGLAQQQFGTNASLASAEANAQNQRTAQDQQFALGQGGLNQQSFATQSANALGQGNLQNQRNAQDQQYALGLGGLGQQQYATNTNLALGAANAQNARYSTDVSQNLGLGNLENQRFANDSQYALGAGGLQNQRYGQDQSFALGQGGLGQQQYSTDTGYSLGQQNAQNSRYATDVSQNLGLGNLANQQYANESQFNLGAAGAQNQRYATDVTQSLGQGNLGLQRYTADQNFGLGQGGLANSRYATDVQQNLGLGNLAQQKFATDTSFALGQGGLNNQKYLGDQSYNIGLAGAQNTANANQNNFYTAQRGQDQAGAALGSALYTQGLQNDWIGPTNAANIYSAFNGFGTSNNTASQGGGALGALGGALGTAQIFSNIGKNATGNAAGWW